MRQNAIFTFIILLSLAISNYSSAQITLAVQDFEVSPAIPTFTFSQTGSTGAYITGNNSSSGRPANEPNFSEGSRGFAANNGTSTLDFNPVDLTNYQNTRLSFRLASYSTTSGNGAETSDLVSVFLSTDGINYVEELRLTGNSGNNSCWGFNATGLAQVNYNGLLNTFAAPGSGLITNGYSSVNINLLPLSPTLYVRIVMTNNSNNEIWVIDEVKITGELNTNPNIILNKSEISNLNYIADQGPSSAQSYEIQGVNLNTNTGNIDINAPTNFEISLNELTGFGQNISLPFTNASLAATSIYVRLVSGLPIGNYGGTGITITHSGGGVTKNLTLSGQVNDGQPCGLATNISTVRSAIPLQSSFTGSTATTITGTVTGIFGNNKFYLQDATAGIAVFSNGVIANNDIQNGDQVTLTGIPARFNGEAQLSTLSCIYRLSGGGSLLPITYDVDSPNGQNVDQFLMNNEGSLVEIRSANILQAGTFSGGTNYNASSCESQGNFEIRIDASATGLLNQTIPTTTQYITGIVGRFINSSGSTNKMQVFPRSLTDFENSTLTCTPTGGCGISVYPSTDSTFEALNFNIEWLGNPSNGPSQSGTNDITQINNAIELLKQSGADLMMLQEICDYNASDPSDVNTAFGKLIQGLNNHFGANAYSGECSSAYSYAGTPTDDPLSQRVCAIYKNSTVSKIFSRPMFENFVPNTYPPTGTPSSFWASGRKPFQLMAEINMRSQKDTVLFIGLHAKAGSQSEDWERRKIDVRAMYDSLTFQYPNRKILILGDMNDDFDQSIYAGNISSYSPFLYQDSNETVLNGVRPNAGWDAISLELSNSGCASTATFSDYIDHQILSNELTNAPKGLSYINGSISSFRPTISNYRNTTSDHYATISKFEFKIVEAPCDQIINLTGVTDDISNGNLSFTVSSTNGKIIASNKITGTSRINFKGPGIELNPGFLAENGVYFLAETGGCN